jgi:hypothetical protein
LRNTRKRDKINPEKKTDIEIFVDFSTTFYGVFELPLYRETPKNVPKQIKIFFGVSWFLESQSNIRRGPYFFVEGPLPVASCQCHAPRGTLKKSDGPRRIFD